MRILLIHADHIKYEAKSKTKFAEEISDEQKSQSAENCLVAFIAVESVDEKNKDSVIKRAKKEILDVYNKVKAESIFIYPYAHLSSDLAKPSFAVEVLKELEEELKNYNVKRAPFGWYKAFELKCKGHPLSELSRVIVPEEAKKEKEVVSVALKAEEKIKSYWYILTPDGELIEADKFDFSGYENLKKLYEYEKKKVRTAKEQPAHIRLMLDHELVDYEPASDPGNLRWYPKGVIIKRLLETHVSNMLIEYGAMEVETPIMYSFDHEKLSKYLHRFPARQYTLKSGDKEYFLRFAACFGQYLIMHDMQISYRHLPLRLYELTHYSFRREQKGELSGLKRLRTFTMPDMHTLCRDMDQAKEEFKNQYILAMKYMRDLGLDYEVVIRFVKSFYEENEDFAKELARLVNRPILLEMWDERFFYFVMKFEFNVIDSIGKAAALSTVQIDVENAKRFDITYVDEEGRKRHPILLHASISGGIDRNLYALLEQAWIKAKKENKKPMLPVWLSPIQIRIIPVSGAYISFCEKLLDELSKIARVDLDDTEDTLQKKIRKAEKEWIPFIVVVGEKEIKENILSVRVRSENKVRKMSKEELIEIIKKENEGKPFKKLTLPKKLSKRPKFR